MKITFENIADYLNLIVARKRHFARKHNVENDAHRPYVDFLRVVLEKDFRSDVVWLHRSY